MEEILFEQSWFSHTKDGIFLCGSKCKACGKTFFPKKRVCLNCFDDQLIDVLLSRRGKLHTFAIAHIGIPEIETPYVMGFIDLPEKIKLYSILTDCEPWNERLKIDMEMEMVMGVIRHNPGQNIISYKFRPVKEI